MALLVVLAALVGTALAVPQIAFKPAYQPLPYAAPARVAYKPVAYSAPAYVKPVAYSAPVAPVAPLAYTKPLAYSAPVAPVYKPAVQAYAAPVAYNPLPSYSAQYVKPIAIVRQSQDDNFDGSFSYDFESEDGIAAQATGYLKNPGTDVEAQVIQGQYSYTAPDGTPIVTRYYADETGFHAEGAHIPTSGAEPFRTA